MSLPPSVATFMAAPAPAAGKVNGRSVPDVAPALAALGPLTILGHLARSPADVSVTWRTASGTVGATRFTLDGDGNIVTVAARWEGL